MEEETTKRKDIAGETLEELPFLTIGHRSITHVFHLEFFTNKLIVFINIFTVILH